MSADIQPVPDDATFGAVGRGTLTRLASGGDDRITVDAGTGRNAYGTWLLPRPGIVQFASSTASTIGKRGCQAVEQIGQSLGQRDRWTDSGIAALCGSVRSRLQAMFGIEGSAVVLAASGTDAELLALWTVMRLGDAPVTNLVMAPGETGSGVMDACTGRHFRSRTCLGIEVGKGERLAGWEDADIETAAVNIRLPDGRVRSRESLEDDVESIALDALRRGRTVVLHVLDTSKTGLRISTRVAARRLMKRAPGRVHVVVDACQLRCTPGEVRADLRDGFSVIVTGSKFAGGPPFSGALLLPPALVDASLDASPLPEGLSAYTAAHDWPRLLRGSLGNGLRRHNEGPALRWVAALAEFGAFGQIEPAVVEEIGKRFEADVRQRVDALPFVAPLFADADAVPRARSIVPLVALDTGGTPLSAAQASDLHRALRTGLGEGGVMQREIAVGQPVAAGERTALRVCIDASRIADIAVPLAAGRTMDEAFAPTMADLDALFAKWTALIDGKV